MAMRILKFVGITVLAILAVAQIIWVSDLYDRLDAQMKVNENLTARISYLEAVRSNYTYPAYYGTLGSTPAVNSNPDPSKIKLLAELRTFYDVCNSRYFDGKLSSEVKIEFSSDGWTYGSWSATRRIITVDRSHAEGNMRMAKMTILHEMVHAYLDILGNENENEHAVAFQREMLRLAKAGAFEGLW